MAKANQAERDVIINHDEGEVLVFGKPVHFAPRQYKLIHSLIKANGKIIARKDLIENMYKGSDLGNHVIDSRAVDQGVCRVRKLLGRAARYLKTVGGGRGYRWVAR